MAQKWESLLALLENLKEEDAAEVERLLKEVDLKSVVLLLKELSDNAEAIADLIRFAKALRESGVLALLEGVVESTDENFNALLRPGAMKAIGNFGALAYMISLFNNAMLMKAAETTPRCVDRAISEAPQNMRPLGILELIRILRSPEVGAAVRGLHTTLKCLSGK
ncbi:MAG: hypothetical protein ABDH61_06120 [Acidilobaceae archaeon]